MPIIKMRAPNSDTNGVNVQGYDRIQRDKVDGLFHVHDSNLAAILRQHPWNFVDVADEPKAKSAAEKKPVEEKTLEEMNKAELTAWLTERGQEDLAGFNKAELLELAKGVKKAADDKAGSDKKDE